MADQALIAYQKTIEIADGVITRMYWAHSSGNDDFLNELSTIRGVWEAQWPDENHLSLPFLVARRFARIIVDGAQVYPT